MSLIGIIAEGKDEEILRKTLEKKLNINRKEHTIIAINEKSIDNIKKIKFETIIVMSIKQIRNKKYAISLILKNVKYLIINADIEESLEMMNDMKLNIITFGFNQKATITTSSVEDNLMICIQRRILDVNKNIIEPQEIKVEIIGKKLPSNTHNLIGIASILLIYGKKDIKF